MSYCQKCGAYIPDGETRCLACGWSPEDAASSQSAPGPEREPRREESGARAYSYGAGEEARSYSYGPSAEEGVSCFSTTHLSILPHLGHQSALAGTMLPHSGQVTLSEDTSSVPSAWTTTFSSSSSKAAPHLGQTFASAGTSAPHSEHVKESFFWTLISSGTSM